MSGTVRRLVVCWIVGYATLASVVLLPASAQVEIKRAFPALTFDTPVDIQSDKSSPEYLYVVERAGVIRRFPNSPDVQASNVFIDIRQAVHESQEEGLLGLAFHPNYDDNGRFFLYYIADEPRRSVISEFTRVDDRSHMADAASERRILEFEQPGRYHKGGQLRFGPDGFLYISSGDGGPGFYEERGTGEDLTTLLGSILRIDVDQAGDGRPYAIPDDNPFVGNREGWREEIFAYGFRNPWRFSFDRDDLRKAVEDAPLFVADVGAGTYEEVNIVKKGSNYGWSDMEGSRCFALSPECDRSGRTYPVWEYRHNLGAAIIGGFVYRGSEIPSQNGRYIYGDFASGRIWGLDFDAAIPQNYELSHADSLLIHAFGEDADGELYVAAGDGRLFKLAPGEPSPGEIPSLAILGFNHPNPFRDRTTIRYTVAETAHIRLVIYNALGQTVQTLVDSEISMGTTHAAWDGLDASGRRAAAGVYFYRLTANSAPVSARQMILVR